MVILNETVIIDPEIEAEWLSWIKTVHMPAVMATGYFENSRILNVLNSPNEGITYCLQYEASNIEEFETYKFTVGDALKSNHLKKFENKLVLFESIMQVIN
jgi:hypothetical protein